MREVNIRKGGTTWTFSTLGDYAFDANDYVAPMLPAEPKNRPTAKEILRQGRCMVHLTLSNLLAQAARCFFSSLP